jgi:hypothetical protein
VLVEGLRQPFGMALVGDQLYIANTDSVVRFRYSEGTKRIEDNGTKILDLPVGHHWTRNLVASPDGSKLYETVGSGSNIGENGLDKEEGRATILEVELKTGQSRIYASGLRNANGMVFEPTTGLLWTVVNERDEIGDDVPPDYLTSVKDGYRTSGRRIVRRHSTGIAWEAWLSRSRCVEPAVMSLSKRRDEAQLSWHCKNLHASTARRSANGRSCVQPRVAKDLGNTPAICRRCYIHPAIFEGFLNGTLLATLAEKTRFYLAQKIEG